MNHSALGHLIGFALAVSLLTVMLMFATAGPGDENPRTGPATVVRIGQ